MQKRHIKTKNYPTVKVDAAHSKNSHASLSRKKRTKKATKTDVQSNRISMENGLTPSATQSVGCSAPGTTKSVNSATSNTNQAASGSNWQKHPDSVPLVLGRIQISENV